MPKSPFDSLVRDGILTREALASATQDSPGRQKSIGWLLVNEHGISLEAVGKALSAFYRVPFVAYTEGLKPLEKFSARLSLELCAYYRVVPLPRENNRMVLLMADPGDLPAKDQLETHLGEPFAIRVALEEDIRQLMRDGAPPPEDLLASLDALSAEPEQEANVESTEESGEGESAVVGVLNAILVNCLQQKGEEIRFDPRESPAAAWRVAGEWRELPVPAAMLQSLVRRLKVMSNLDIGNRAKPQDGFFQMQLFQSRARFEVSVEPLGGGDEAARVVPRP